MREKNKYYSTKIYGITSYKHIQEGWNKRKICTSELDTKFVDFKDPIEES